MSEAQRKAKTTNDEDELVAVGPGVDQDAGETLSVDDEEEEEQAGEAEGDARLSADAEEERPKRRESAKDRRTRQKAQRDRERKELSYYRSRNDQLEKERSNYLQSLEGRVDQLSTAAIDQRITKIEEQKALADTVSFQAMKEGSREDYQKAQDIRDRLTAELSRLQYSKQEANRQKATPKAPTVDPVIAANGQRWTQQNAWFDPNSSDADALVVWALDEGVQQDGFDPRSPEYWTELTRRCQKRLPERFRTGAREEEAEDGDDDEEERKPVKASGPKFSAGGRERPLKKGEVYISAERKQALIDAGLWEDAKTRQRMLKRYSEIDAETSASRA